MSRFPHYLIVLKNAVELDENERVHLRLACRKSVKNETRKYVVFILVGSCGTSGQRKCTLNESVVLQRLLYRGKGIGSLSADEQESLLARTSLWGLASPLFRRK